jgi:ABC-type iron transport system FetAB ATPase subunit
MRDFVLDAPHANRHTYFVAHYGKEYQRQTAVLHVRHDFDDSIETLHRLIRSRINEVLGEDTPSCYHILALAAPEAIPV